ncbi:MAG TPA: D-alanyl-D-alanine carboxypeptidase, partial [Candidatus Moranbacteria bacterium]|nr:D-alanyl-D-alanine carboxypeptidase [Candidatus Moranbacteria bacterium]
MHPLKKQILALVLTVIILLQVAAVPAPAAPAEVELALGSTAAVLIDGENGTVLYEKNARTALPPASITKIMTLLLAMEDLQSGRIDWETTVTVSERAWRTGAS